MIDSIYLLLLPHFSVNEKYQYQSIAVLNILEKSVGFRNTREKHKKNQLSDVVYTLLIANDGRQ